MRQFLPAPDGAVSVDVIEFAPRSMGIYYRLSDGSLIRPNSLRRVRKVYGPVIISMPVSPGVTGEAVFPLIADHYSARQQW
jgi:hypothetical protein